MAFKEHNFTTFNSCPLKLNSSPPEPQTLVPSAEYIKHCEKANRQNFHVWNSHRQHAACGYSTQRRTIGSFSATAGLLVFTGNAAPYNANVDNARVETEKT